MERHKAVVAPEARYAHIWAWYNKKERSYGANNPHGIRLSVYVCYGIAAPKEDEDAGG